MWEVVGSTPAHARQGRHFIRSTIRIEIEQAPCCRIAWPFDVPHVSSCSSPHPSPPAPLSEHYFLLRNAVDLFLMCQMWRSLGVKLRFFLAGLKDARSRIASGAGHLLGSHTACSWCPGARNHRQCWASGTSTRT